VSEDDDAEKRAAEDETELAQKQKYVIEDRVRTPKRDKARFPLFVVCFQWSMISVSHPKHLPVPA
jgi:hypothetical protein